MVDGAVVLLPFFPLSVDEFLYRRLAVHVHRSRKGDQGVAEIGRAMLHDHCFIGLIFSRFVDEGIKAGIGDDRVRRAEILDVADLPDDAGDGDRPGVRNVEHVVIFFPQELAEFLLDLGLLFLKEKDMFGRESDFEIRITALRPSRVLRQPGDSLSRLLREAGIRLLPHLPRHLLRGRGQDGLRSRKCRKEAEIKVAERFLLTEIFGEDCPDHLEQTVLEHVQLSVDVGEAAVEGTYLRCVV